MIELRLDVPGLIERPAVGTTCCAATAEAIIAQELTMLPGIEDVAVDLDAAIVSVTFNPAAVSQAEIENALEEVGYPGTVAVER